jgi:hypothetical protein
MKIERLKGFVKLSLAHHPLCEHFRSHTLQIGGINLCLGCSGFYGGILIGILVIVISWNLTRIEWFSLVVISTVMLLTTIFRLMNIPFFSTKRKSLRLLFRLLLGFGVAIGLVSLVIVPNVLIGLIQFLLGMGLYLGIGINRIRSKDMWIECQDCLHTISINCPGYTPFHLGKDSNR